MSNEKKEIEHQVFDLLEATGLNWTVLKEPLVSAVDGKKSSSFGLFRKDNGLHLDTVTDRYMVLQNHEVAAALIEATREIGLQTSRGGQLAGGKHIYLQAELPDQYIGKSNLKRWLTGLNTHGSQSAAFGSTNTVIICQNTFYQAFGELTKYRHTASIHERVKEFVKGIKIAMGLEAQEIKIFKTMADVPLKEEVFAAIMKACFTVDINDKTTELSTRSKNKMTEVATALETEIRLEGATMWGLFNGITRYTNHVAGQAKQAKTPEELQTYLMVGEGYEVNLKAYKTIHEWLIEQGLLTLEAV